MLCRCVLASLFTRTERIYLSMYIFFMSLGCDKNLVDSEEMLGALVSRGFEVTDDESQAEVIVVNTCCFIHDAKEESIQAILDMANYKTEGNLKALIVTGCLAQRYKEEITKERSGRSSWYQQSGGAFRCRRRGFERKSKPRIYTAGRDSTGTGKTYDHNRRFL